MDLWLIWLITAAVLILVEVLSQQVWTLCLAGGCIGGLVGDLLGLDPVWQVIVMALLGVVAFFVLMPWFRKWHDKTDRRHGRDSRTGMDALLGRRAIVTEEIRPGAIGRARIDGDYWQVRAPGCSATVERGQEVTVTSYDSIILDVAVG